MKAKAKKGTLQRSSGMSSIRRQFFSELSLKSKMVSRQCVDSSSIKSRQSADFFSTALL